MKSESHGSLEHKTKNSKLLGEMKGAAVDQSSEEGREGEKGVKTTAAATAGAPHACCGAGWGVVLRVRHASCVRQGLLGMLAGVGKHSPPSEAPHALAQNMF